MNGVPSDAHRLYMRPKRNRFILLALALAAATVRAAAPDAVMLALACDGCHGTLGVSAGATIPSLAGQSKDYFAAAMKQFRSGERPSTVMGRLARAYSDAQIEAMAAFYARIKPVPQNGPATAELVEKGRAVYYRQCKYCHLERGRLWAQIHQGREYDRQCRHCHADYGSDTPGDTPNIAGQWPEYLKLQLQDFKNGSRRMSKAKAQKLKSLSDDDMEAVARFYAAQAAE